MMYKRMQQTTKIAYVHKKKSKFPQAVKKKSLVKVAN